MVYAFGEFPRDSSRAIIRESVTAYEIGADDHAAHVRSPFLD
jgi:hypothetical protein